MKKCSKCNEIKPETEFHKNKDKADGLDHRCKYCANIYRQKYYRENRNRLLEQRREYYKANREKVLKSRKDRYNNPMNSKLRIVQNTNKPYLCLSNGKHYHRFIAEQTLGRKLKPNEIVHHIDGNSLNNSLNNLLICDRAYHVYLHSENSQEYG